jgi:putative transposase
LAERKDAWERGGIRLNYYDQASKLKEMRRNTELGRLNFSACQQVLRRLDKAFKAFFRRLKAGRKPGYPRFKRPHRFRSLGFRFGDGASLRDERLYVQNVGEIKVKWHRHLPEGKIKDVVITRKADGWYATFRVKLSDDEFVPNGNPPVGVDVGIVNLVALSDGKTLQAPRWYQKAQEKLSTKGRILSQKVKGSKRWKRMRRQIAKLHLHIACQRKDFWHKFTRWLVGNYGLIAVEDLNIMRMVQGFLPKQILDSGWSIGFSYLRYKAWSAGAQVVLVNSSGTSQRCSGCGTYVSKTLSKRVHACSSCGLILDRDINAARNILLLGLGASLRGEQTLLCPKEAVGFSQQ